MIGTRLVISHLGWYRAGTVSIARHFFAPAASCNTTERSFEFVRLATKAGVYDRMDDLKQTVVSDSLKVIRWQIAPRLTYDVLVVRDEQLNHSVITVLFTESSVDTL